MNPVTENLPFLRKIMVDYCYYFGSPLTIALAKQETGGFQDLQREDSTFTELLALHSFVKNRCPVNNRVDHPAR